MPGQVIGTVNVQVNSQTGGRVSTMNSGIRSLKWSTDLSMVAAADGDVITYSANTNSFSVSPVEAKAIGRIDAGEF